MKKNYFKATLMVIAAMAVSIFAVNAASLNSNKPKTASVALNIEAAPVDYAQSSLMYSSKVVCGHSMVRGSCNVPGHGCKGFCDGNGDNYCDNCPGKCHAVTHQPK